MSADVNFDPGAPDVEPAPAGRPSGRLLPRSALKTLPPVEPLIAEVVSLRSAVVLVGATGAGKTFTAIGMACSVATGTPWLGRAVRRTAVLYVVGEGAYGLDSRVSAWEGANATPVGDDDLVFLVKPDSLSMKDTWSELLAHARGIGSRFIVLDTFSSLAPDADETKDAAMIMRRLSDLAVALDGTAMLVHHPGWSDPTRTRGGYQFEANADEVLVLFGDAYSDVVELERKKVKEGQSGARMGLRRVPAHGSVVMEPVLFDAPGALPEWFRNATENQSKIMTVVADHFPMIGGTKAEIRGNVVERFSMKRTSFNTAWDALVSKEILIKVDGVEKYVLASLHKTITNPYQTSTSLA